MPKPVPDLDLLAQAVRSALRRGVPIADAEDIAVLSWERAQAAWDAERGAFEPLFQRVLQRQIADWWRTVARRAEVAPPPGLASEPVSGQLEAVCRNQERLLQALTEEERAVFATWALQKQLPQGQLTADRAAASLGMDVRAYDNAKRRLKGRILALAEAFGLAPADFFSCAEGEGPRRTHANG
jgi:DNA-directed RNA polymerase specialized sigma24 family protein